MINRNIASVPRLLAEIVVVLSCHSKSSHIFAMCFDYYTINLIATSQNGTFIMLLGISC